MALLYGKGECMWCLVLAASRLMRRPQAHNLPSPLLSPIPLQVRIPHTNWLTVFDSNPATYYSFLMGKGFERVYMPEGLQVYVVKNPTHVGAALKALRASMRVSLGVWRRGVRKV